MNKANAMLVLAVNAGILAVPSNELHRAEFLRILAEGGERLTATHMENANDAIVGYAPTEDDLIVAKSSDDDVVFGMWNRGDLDTTHSHEEEA